MFLNLYIQLLIPFESHIPCNILILLIANQTFSFFFRLSSGRFLCSVYVPMAKAISLNTDNIDDEEKKKLGIEKNWKEIPFLMMMAVDRDTEGKVSQPVYKDTETSLPKEIMDSIDEFFVARAHNFG